MINRSAPVFSAISAPTISVLCPGVVPPIITIGLSISIAPLVVLGISLFDFSIIFVNIFALTLVTYIPIESNIFSSNLRSLPSFMYFLATFPPPTIMKIL